MNIYSEPKAYDLETIGEIDWSDGCYQFDLTVVWRRKNDGQYLYGDDAGCSCPSPFEDKGTVDLVPIATVAELQAHLDKRAEETYWRDYEQPASGFKAMERANLIAKLVMPT